MEQDVGGKHVHVHVPNRSCSKLEQTYALHVHTCTCSFSSFFKCSNSKNICRK